MDLIVTFFKNGTLPKGRVEVESIKKSTKVLAFRRAKVIQALVFNTILAMRTS